MAEPLQNQTEKTFFLIRNLDITVFHDIWEIGKKLNLKVVKCKKIAPSESTLNVFFEHKKSKEESKQLAKNYKGKEFFVGILEGKNAIATWSLHMEDSKPSLLKAFILGSKKHDYVFYGSSNETEFHLDEMFYKNITHKEVLDVMS